MSGVPKAPWSIALALVFMVPVAAIIDALIFRSVWDRLIAADYGAGPSFHAWVGISLTVGLALMNVSKSKVESATELVSEILLGRVVAYAAMMWTAFVVGLAT